jgi:hypothetical protein
VEQRRRRHLVLAPGLGELHQEPGDGGSHAGAEPLQNLKGVILKKLFRPRWKILT